MPMTRTYKQRELYVIQCEQRITNNEPVRVQFQIADKKTRWLNLSPEEIHVIYNLFGKEE